MRTLLVFIPFLASILITALLIYALILAIKVMKIYINKNGQF